MRHHKLVILGWGYPVSLHRQWPRQGAILTLRHHHPFVGAKLITHRLMLKLELFASPSSTYASAN